MEVQELAKKIHDDYPEVFYRLALKIYKNNFQNINQLEAIFKKGIVGLSYVNATILFLNAKCYCFYENFFEENDIVISFEYSVEIDKLYFTIFDKNVGSTRFDTDFRYYKRKTERLEAKVQAILKACEIYSKSLK